MPRDYTALPPTANQRLPEYRRDDEWICAFLERALVGHLAHVADGQPYATPTNFWFERDSQCIFIHSNISGRLRWNLERQPRVCFTASEHGRFLPSNAALEVSLQYRSVMAFGAVHIIVDEAEKRRVLSGMLAKYFPQLRAGIEMRPITDRELQRTCVYAIRIDAWSGKENWQEQAEQTDEWPTLPPGVRDGTLADIV